MKKILISVLCVIIITTVIITATIIKNSKNDSKENITTVKLNEVTRSVFYAPQYIAINQNFFKEEGINIGL